MNIYMVGIKGSGMAALALILHNLNNNVSGADVEQHLFTENKLLEKNIRIDSFENMNYEDADLIIIGNAYLDKFSFINKKVISYQQALSKLSDSYFSIAVCGTHGKTTTTNMIRHILSSFCEVSYLIGDGNGFASNESKYFVYEACEHKDHFLSYYPNIIVCTNIDYDHVEYFASKKQYKDSFKKFFKQAKDCIIVNECVSCKENNKITFGINNSTIRAFNIKYNSSGILFSLNYKSMTYKNLHLPFFGKHMLLNSLAAICCCIELGFDVLSIINALKTYKEAGRRYNLSFFKSNVIVDDYGHHPTEIDATIKAIEQEFPAKKLIIIYHPDRPKRLLAFMKEYIKVFENADSYFVLPFINNDVEKEAALSLFMKQSSAKTIDSSFYINKYTDCVFLFTGSKEMKDIIKNLITFL